MKTWMNPEENIPDVEREILHNLTYMWNLKEPNSKNQRVEWQLSETGLGGIENVGQHIQSFSYAG